MNRGRIASGTRFQIPHPPPQIEVILGSLVEAALKGGGANDSNIWQFGGDASEACAMGALPLYGVDSRSKILCLAGFELCLETGSGLTSSLK